MPGIGIASSAYVQIAGICVACVLVIVLYGTYRCHHAAYVDPLTRAHAPPPWDKFLDGWGISHFLFYAALAFLYPAPQHLVFIWLLGVLWECAETVVKDHPFYLASCDARRGGGPTTANGEGWWYGRWQDIVMNSLGMLAGWGAAQVLRR